MIWSVIEILTYGFVTLITVLTLGATLYGLFFATIYFVLKKENQIKYKTRGYHRFALIIPAHNEEILIEDTVQNLLKMDYNADSYSIFVVVDNCSDKTKDICSHYPINIMERKDNKNIGKGFAIQWAIERIEVDRFDAILIIDADCTAKLNLLKVLSRHLSKGEDAIQCYIEVPNRNDSWFTEIIFVSRVINNRLFHYPRYRLGLTIPLMGTGMCFSKRTIKNFGWLANGLSEDWEYYSMLVENGVRTSFAIDAVIYQRESTSLRQATSQRFRWARGRFDVVRAHVAKLLFAGINNRNFRVSEAALVLILPNLSMLININLLIILGNYILHEMGASKAIFIMPIFSVICLITIIFMGTHLSGNYKRMFVACLMSPIFLLWKFGIDFLSFTGIYRSGGWVRTNRCKIKMKRKD
jgi:cellulose synthase/poly-beta-1,6-N-acetylglucosamine synthase-like glycosyltransferase